MHAVAPEVSPAHEYDDSSRPTARVRVAGTQTFALHATKRSVVEVKMQIADRAVLLVTYLPISVGTARACVVVDRRQRIRQCAEGERSRALEAALQSFARLQLPDPHGTVPGGSANGLVAASDDCAGLTGEFSLRARIEQSEATIE